MLYATDIVASRTRIENVSCSQASICIAVVTASRCHAGVARRNDHSSALHTELHELVALALLVVGREVVFLFTVADANNVCRLVHTALTLNYTSAIAS